MKQGNIRALVEVGARFLWADAQRRLLVAERDLPPSRTDYHTKAEKLLDHPALLDALYPPREDAVGGGVPAGMVLERWGFKWQGHDHGTHVQMPDGYWTPWHVAQAALDAATPKAASSYDGDAARERIARIMYDAWPHTVISPALAEVTGLPIGEVLTWDRAKEAGADFSGLYRYADAILAAQPTSDASERLREAVQHEIDQLRTADSSWAVGIRTRLKVALSNNEVSNAK